MPHGIGNQARREIRDGNRKGVFVRLKGMRVAIACLALMVLVVACGDGAVIDDSASSPTPEMMAAALVELVSQYCHAHLEPDLRTGFGAAARGPTPRARARAATQAGTAA